MRAKLVCPLMVVFAVLLLSACRVVVDTNINDNGSGELRSSVVFSAEEKQNFTGSPENAGKSICGNLRGNVPADATFVEEEKDHETFCTTARFFSNIGELRGYYESMGNVTVNELKMGFGKFVFDAQVDLTPKNGNQPVAMEWRLTTPGELGNNNSDAIEGQTLVWNIEPGEIATLHAESAVGLNVGTLAVLMGGILVVAAILVLILARRRR